MMEGYEQPPEIEALELDRAAKDIDTYIEAAEVSEELKAKVREAVGKLFEEAARQKQITDPAEIARYSLTALHDGVFDFKNQEEVGLFEAIKYTVWRAVYQVEGWNWPPEQPLPA